MTTPPKHRLRWYQYSLRSLFVLTVLVAIAGSWFAVKRQQVERQRAAVKAIKELGGDFVYDWQLEQAEAGNDDGTPGPAWLKAWLGDDFFANVAWVSLFDTEVTDAGLKHLEVLYQLTVLRLSYTQVTDAGLEHLEGLTQLTYLSLDTTQVTDAGLEHLKGLTQLERLRLDNTRVTDEGVKKLQEALPNCEITR